MTTSVVVRQVRSAIGHPKRELATLRAMGLGRPGKKKVLVLNKSVEGMIKSVSHLVIAVKSDRLK